MPAVMYDFEIYFFGLICIHGASIERNAPPGKTHALLLEDDDHVPVIYLNSKNSKDEIKLKNHVTFNNLPTGESGFAPSFNTFVPHLVPLTRSFVKLYPYPNTPGVQVPLPEGLFAAVQRYPYVGRYILDGNIPYVGCVARLTLLQVTTPYPEVVIDYDGTLVNVPANGYVFIGNREKKPSERTGNEVVDEIPAQVASGERPDFKKYHVVTTGVPDELANLYELSSKPCDPLIANPSYIKANHRDDAIDIARIVADHPECSNTQWP